MARTRSPNRDRAYELWKERGGKIANREIAAALGEDEKKIAVWKQRDKWSVVQQSESVVQQKKDCCTTRKPKKKRGGQPGNGNAKGHGAPLGNKNAVGNRGGAPPGNKNALISGKYERIFFSCLDEEEQEIYEKLNTDELALIDMELKILTIRERKMMARLRETEKKKEDIEERITQVVGASTLKNAVYDEVAGQMKDASVTTLVPKEIVQMKKSNLEKILRIERDLTDIQAKKTKAIDTKHRIMRERQEAGMSAKEDPFDDLSVDELRRIVDEG